VPIDIERRRLGLGASEIASVLNLNPYSDPFAVYISKVDPIIQKPTVAQRRGHFLERGVAQWFAEDTGKEVEWFDQMEFHQQYPWMFASPDAWIIEAGVRVAELQIKTVGFRNVDDYGDGPDEVPIYTAVQCHWTMAVTDKPYCIVAALVGLDDLRTYQIWRDKEIERVLIEEGDRFWHQVVLARKPPPIGCSPSAAAYLKQKYPRNITPLRVATPEESILLRELKMAKEIEAKAIINCTAAENRVKLAIQDGEGLLDGKTKVTLRKSKDTTGVDWERATQSVMEDIAKALALPLDQRPEFYAKMKRQLISQHCVTVKEGGRVLKCTWGKK
jgi:predicted phage-related endonuclease